MSIEKIKMDEMLWCLVIFDYLSNSILFKSHINLAASYNDKEVVKILIDNGADVNATDNFNYTPLTIGN